MNGLRQMPRSDKAILATTPLTHSILRASAPCEQDIFLSLNCADAQATVESDRLEIINSIRSSTGIEPMNRFIRQALVDSAKVCSSFMLKYCQSRIALHSVK